MTNKYKNKQPSLPLLKQNERHRQQSRTDKGMDTGTGNDGKEGDRDGIEPTHECVATGISFHFQFTSRHKMNRSYQ